MSIFTKLNITKANKLYKLINYDSWPEENETNKKNIPYSKGPFISSPLLHYLIANKIYDSHGSGIEDFGMMLKPFAGIPENRFVMIETIDEHSFKITYVVEPIDKVLQVLMSDIDYDMRLFDKLGFTKKSKIIKLNFDFSEEVEETVDINIANLGILPYNELLLGKTN